jgi:hypothetical protein
VIYLDTSAFVKLVRGERETSALQRFLTEHQGTPARLERGPGGRDARIGAFRLTMGAFPGAAGGPARR